MLRTAAIPVFLWFLDERAVDEPYCTHPPFIHLGFPSSQWKITDLASTPIVRGEDYDGVFVEPGLL